MSNTTDAYYAVPTLVHIYRQQPVQERGFARLKTRKLQIRPVYLRDEQRIQGVLWLVVLALRVLVLTEQRLRTALVERNEQVTGLNPAWRAQATQRPTTERVIAAFGNITLTTIDGAGLTHRHVSPLNRTQQHILDLLYLPPISMIGWLNRYRTRCIIYANDKFKVPGEAATVHPKDPHDRTRMA